MTLTESDHVIDGIGPRFTESSQPPSLVPCLGPCCNNMVFTWNAPACSLKCAQAARPAGRSCPPRPPEPPLAVAPIDVRDVTAKPDSAERERIERRLAELPDATLTINLAPVDARGMVQAEPPLWRRMLRRWFR